MDPPSTAAGSGAGGDSQPQQPDPRQLQPPSPRGASDNRFSVSPQLFVRSSDVLSKSGPKPPTRRRTRHKVLDSRYNSVDVPDGASGPSDGPPTLSQQQRQYSVPGMGGNEADGAKPDDQEQVQTKGEAVVVANAEKNGVAGPTVAVQEPEGDVGAVRAPFTAKPGTEEHGPAPQENIQLVVTAPAEQLPAVLTSPSEKPACPDVEEETHEVNPEESILIAERAGDEARLPVYLQDSSSDTDSDVELITAGDVGQYEQPTPPPGEEEGQQSGEEESPSEKAEGSHEEQPGEEAARNGHPGEEVTRNGQPGEEVTRNGQPGEEAPRNGQPGEEVTRNGQPGRDGPKDLAGERPHETIGPASSNITSSPSPLSKPKRPPPPPKPPKPSNTAGDVPVVVQGAQSNSPRPQDAPASPILRPVESNRPSQKKKVPPSIIPLPYAAKTAAIPPLPPKKSRPAPPPRAHTTHLSATQEQSSLTTMPGRDPSPSPPTPTSSVAKRSSADESSLEGEGIPPGTSPSSSAVGADHLKQRPRVPSPPREEVDGGGSPVDEAPVHLMSKPEYVHSQMTDNRVSMSISVAPSSPTSTLSRVGRRLSIGLIKELATQEALASYDVRMCVCVVCVYGVCVWCVCIWGACAQSEVCCEKKPFCVAFLPMGGGGGGGWWWWWWWSGHSLLYVPYMLCFIPLVV